MLARPAPPPRTLLLTTDAVGGVWRYSLDLARGLTRADVRTALVVVGPPPSAAQMREAESIASLELHVAGGLLDWMAESETAFRTSTERLIDLAGDIGADTIQLHAPAYAGFEGWPAPVVAVAHSCTATWWSAVHGTALPADLRWRGNATRAGMLCADAVIAPSLAFANSLRAVHGIERAINVVCNGSESPSRAGASRYGVFTAGRLWDAAKNAVALDAAAASLAAPIRAAGPVVGPHGQTIDLPHLKLLGTLSHQEMTAEYAGAAVFASVARYEPFGLAVLEAARAGCALVLSDIDTFVELWDGAALFVDAGDTDMLAAVLRSLVQSPQRCRALAELAHARAAGFSVDAMARATWAIHRACATAAVAAMQA